MLNYATMETVIFQSAKLGNLQHILLEIDWANSLLENDPPVDRIYGVSGGALAALAFSLSLSAQKHPHTWGQSKIALAEIAGFLRKASSRQIRAINPNPWYGPYNLKPLRRWLTSLLQKCIPVSVQKTPIEQFMLSELPIELYLCAADQDGTMTLFGKFNPALTFQYHAIPILPPQDAPLLDAVIASLSTVLSTEPMQVNGAWYRDCRPAVVDAGAIIFDLHKQENSAADPAEILHTQPHAPVRTWKQNWITSSFIMLSQNERNQTLLAAYYLDLQTRHNQLKQILASLYSRINPQAAIATNAPSVCHVDLPYVGSTEAFTNMRQSVENKEMLMARFREILNGQLDKLPFHQPANVIYGAGGFSGILAGLVTTRAVDMGFEEHGGEIRQIYGVSAGVLNGFFHAVQIAANRYPDLYQPAARNALNDLENFIAHIKPAKIAQLNLNPVRFWQGWANLNPLRNFLLERLAVYTGSRNPAQITFDDIGLPMTIAAARLDGFTDFLGMASTNRCWQIGGVEWHIISSPIIHAILAGWSMNTYILPTRYRDQTYTDGGSTFYDPALFVACMDQEFTNLLNIHLDEPDGHSYNLPPRPNLLRILFDTHNYYFPEERRRMRALTDLLFEHYQLRAEYNALRATLSPPISLEMPYLEDFRRNWNPEYALAIAHR